MRIISANITGSLILNGVDVTDSLVSSSINSGSFTQKIDSLQSSTSSLNSFTSSYSTGSFTGSFKGDGSNLYNIPATGVTGLQLDKIASGAVTASVSSNGFNVNSNVAITGSIVASGTSLVSGSSQVNITGTTGYSTFSSSISTSIGSLSSSVATTTVGTKNRVDSIEAKTGSYATTGSNTFIGTENITGNLTVTGSVIISSGSAVYNSSLNLTDTSSLTLNSGSNLYVYDSGIISGTFKGSVTGSLGINGNVSITGSIVASGTSLVSGSSQIDITSTTNYTTFSSSVSSSIGNLSSSVATTTLNLSSSVSSSIGSLSSSVATTTSDLSSSIGLLSSSVATNTSGLAGRITTIEGNYATTGSNVFVGSQVITGSLYITTDLIVQGSSSLQNITASAVSIGTNTVILNTDTPAVRFAGISVQDSGSNAGVTGSIFWDGLCNRWVYSNPSGVGYSGGMLLSGPRTSTLGTESPLTCNYVAKSGGGDHLYDSCIQDVSGSVTIGGTLCTSGVICAPIIVGSTNICSPQIYATTNLTANTAYVQPNVESGAAGLYLQNNNTGGYGVSLGLGLYGYTTNTYFNTLRIESSYPAYGRTLFFTKSQSNSAEVLALNWDGTGVATFSCTICAPSFVGGKGVFSVGNTSCVGLYSSSGVAITSQGGNTGNIYQISFGYGGGGATYGSSALYGLTESSTGYNTGALVFATRELTTDTAPIERMRINSCGNIGIGTNTPCTMLHVQGQATIGCSTYRTRIDGSSSGTWISFGTLACTNLLGRIGTYESAYVLDSNNGNISFRFGGTEKAHINSAGLSCFSGIIIGTNCRAFGRNLTAQGDVVAYYSDSENITMGISAGTGAQSWGIQVCDTGDGGSALHLNARGGNVGINKGAGITADYALDVSGAIRATSTGIFGGLTVNGGINAGTLYTTTQRLTNTTGNYANMIHKVQGASGGFSQVVVCVSLNGAGGWGYIINGGSTSLGSFQSGGGYTNGIINYSHGVAVGSGYTVSSPADNVIRFVGPGGVHPFTSIQMFGSLQHDFGDQHVCIYYS